MSTSEGGAFMNLTRLSSLKATRRAIDCSLEAFGELEGANNLLGDPEALRERMAAEGYLFLPGLLRRAEVLAARRAMAERLSAHGLLDPRAPLMDTIARPGADVAFMPELAQYNPALSQL